MAKPGKAIRGRRLFLSSFLAALLFGVAGLAVLVLVVSLSPGTGTHGADMLRGILGTQPVSDMEAVVFTVQDAVHHILFELKGGTPAAPWQAAATTPAGSFVSIPITDRPSPSATGTSGPVLDKNALNAPDNATPTATPRQLTATPTLSPTPTPWLPAEIIPLGKVPGEGMWESWIWDESGDPVAYRTYLAPDAKRQYAVVAVVAMQLNKLQLHYQLGTEEPVFPSREPRTGQIPASFLQPGILMAAFNGAFKTIHGNYGVLVDGNTLVPMIDGMATLVINKDGSLSMGAWGVDLAKSPGIAVARQNCRLMVDHGEINPDVYNDSIAMWGGTLSGNVVTFRSGIGLSEDGKTLYYFAGNYLSMGALANAMLAAGAYQAMQLDINNYYVLFTRFDVQDGNLVAAPLLPKEMVDNAGRFLGSYSRDYFYVTIK